MEQLAALVTALLAVGSFLVARLSSRRRLRTMLGQQDLIQSLPQDSPARKNIDDALLLTSERYLTSLREGRARIIRDWGEVLAWVLLGVAGYALAAMAPEPSGLNSAPDVLAFAMELVAVLLMVFAAIGWGKAMNKAVFG